MPAQRQMYGCGTEGRVGAFASYVRGDGFPQATYDTQGNQTMDVVGGGWKAAIYVDDRASQVQQDALLKVFTGQLGGDVANLAALIGDVVAAHVEEHIARFIQQVLA